MQHGRMHFVVSTVSDLHRNRLLVDPDNLSEVFCALPVFECDQFSDIEPGSSHQIVSLPDHLYLVNDQPIEIHKFFFSELIEGRFPLPDELILT